MSSRSVNRSKEKSTGLGTRRNNDAPRHLFSDTLYYAVCLPFLPAALFTATAEPRRSSKKHRFTLNPVRSLTNGSFALLSLDGGNERAASDSKKTKALSQRKRPVIL